MQLRSFPESHTNMTGTVIMRDQYASIIPDGDIKYLHYHNVCEVGMCRCGSCLWMVGDSVTAIHPGDIMIVPPGVHHYSRVLDKGCRCEFIYFDEEQLLESCGIQQSVSKRLPKNYPSVIRDENTRFILRSMIETRDTAESALWYTLFLKRLPDNNLLPEIHDEEQLSPAMHRIMLSYAEPLTVADLAAECGLCPSWFSKQFRKEYGISPIEFLNNFRIKVALQLLRGNMSITDIAMMSGFNSQSDLYRHFIKEFGTSPSEYRKKLN